MKKIFLIITVVVVVCGCRQQTKDALSLSPNAVNDVVMQMTDIMVHDVTNPPLATRFYSYACLAGYEVVAQNDSNYKSLHGVLNDYPQLQKPDSIPGYSYQLASVLAMIETAQKMQPSSKLLQKSKMRLLDSCRKAGFSDDVIRASERYAQAVSKKILAYAKADGYNKISNYARYTPVAGEGNWYPTPPAYMSAVEPHFKTVRPFLLDSCAQFKPDPPVPFSKDTASAFFKLLQQNYQLALTHEQRAIAAFWDCNPFAVQDDGHLQIGLKKISPGAHWLGITGIACRQADKSFEEAMQIHALVSVSLMDAFICCWDEKYRSNRIRPETAIRKYLDPNWTPLLQTPPFPEYLSGHSVISAAAATVLTKYFGDNFEYTDDVEVRYGLPPRKFTSFLQAAEEAGLSRFYGGIHYMDAIDNGMEQGLKVGQWVVSRTKDL